MIEITHLMKSHLRFLLAVAAVASPLFNADAADKMTNTLTVSVTMAFQQKEGESAKAFFIPPPRIQQFTTKELIAQMSKSFPTISTNQGTLLQVVSHADEAAPAVFQVKNTNGTITDVSSVLSITTSSNNITSYTVLKKTRIAKTANLGVATTIYDDTTTEANQSTNGIRLSFYGVTRSSFTFTPTQTSGTYNVTQKDSQVGAMGEGFSLAVDTNGSVVTNNFIIIKAAVAAIGSGTVMLKQQ